MDPNYKLKELLDGHKLRMRDAAEPTDIIWENRKWTNRERIIKRFIVIFIMGLALTASFYVVLEGSNL